MLQYDYVDACALEPTHRNGMYRDWCVLDYGVGNDSHEESFVASAIDPFKLIGSTTKGFVYASGPDTSSGTNLPVLEMPWFINDKPSRILIYQKGKLLPEDLKWINCSETPQLQWATEERYEQVFQRIGQFAKLPNDWDSYGGKVIDGRCIDRALEILKYFILLKDRSNFEVPTPFVAPLSTGGIQIEWEEGERYLEIDLLPQLPEIEYFANVRTAAGELHLEGIIKSVSSLKDLLVWFVTGTAEGLGYLRFENIHENLTT
ncbi:MAG: hypothetical protein Q8P24_10275 [Desulfobacterales bacterium]|nr:hypothetical protein [Desulfobacterales bacterium]